MVALAEMQDWTDEQLTAYRSELQNLSDSDLQARIGFNATEMNSFGFTRRNVGRIGRRNWRQFIGWSREEMAAEIMARIVEPNQAMFAERAGAIDWIALAEFIERLLPLILQIIAVF